MHWSIALPLLALSVPAGAGEAPAAPFCRELRRVVDAAAETPPFRSIERGTVAPRLTFGRPCRIWDEAGHRRFTCARAGGAGGPTRDALAAATRACVPEAIRMAEPEGSPIVRLRFGTIAILIDEYDDSLVYSVIPLPVED